MSTTLPAADWLAYLQREYLREYLREGGAAVKFAVAPDPRATSEVVALVRQLAMQEGFVPIVIDAANTKVHLIEQVFFAFAAQVPWLRLTDVALKRFAADEGFPSAEKVPAGVGFAQAIVSHTSMDVDFVRQRLVQRIQTHVYRDRAMTRDFRLAMTWLCQGRLTGSPTMTADADLIEQWLTGRMTRVGELRYLSIFNKINRTNARHHLESLLHWLRVAQIPGTVLILDASRLLVANRQNDGEYYSRSSLIDAYEVLRQFIDGVDDLKGLLLVVAADEAILDPDRRQRGLAAYHALRNRVYDEVRDRDHPNPAGSLVRLTSGGVR